MLETIGRRVFPRLRAPTQRAGRPPGWRRHLFAGLAFVAAVSAGFAVVVAAPQRQALWEVVRACVADEQLSGSPFPCLAVNLASGDDRGSVLLRRPFGEPDTILAPTRKVVGVEDPWLQSPAAPNYFAAALAARALAVDGRGAAPPLDGTALAVNSRFARTQDQLHIHIGCLSASARRKLQASVGALKVGVWGLVGELAPGAIFWGWRTGRADLESVEPFRLVADTLPVDVADRSGLTIVVAGLRIGEREELVVLAALAERRSSHGIFATEEIVDARCSSREGGDSPE
jgi:CDP-diacylglycerol pyrophosphatase